MKVKKVTYSAAVVLASVVGLAGCADVTTDVHATGAAVVLQGERTYAFVRAPWPQAHPASEQYEALVRNELANYGLVDRTADHASYLVSLAYDTRPAAVGVSAADCGNACDGAAGTGFSLFGREYRHSMTLRLFEAASGKEVYKVTATSRDRDADTEHRIPWLVKGALAQFPFAGYGAWRVKLRPGDAADKQVPRVVTMKRVDQ
ncbi:DUF4136 domain-containing protein [Paraburkholderia phymatum]|uniref:DUF4136 domain-containing protein n=1 Tax=Paraburkholderia phymatum TaxID=148447 RepID=A0ACC6U3E5_9BURK